MHSDNSSPRHLTLATLPASERGGVGFSDWIIDYSFVETPLGHCLVGVTAGRICYLAFVPTAGESRALAGLARSWPGAALRARPARADEMSSMLAAAFTPGTGGSGEMRLLVRGTPFQVQVWRALVAIPWGSVSTYAEVAQRVGRPRAVRAIGRAIGANPIAWLIPCHRVIRSDGQLGGYRWGLALKRACLDYEKQHMPVQ